MKVSTSCYQGNVTVNVNKATKSFKFNDYKWTLDITHGNLELDLKTMTSLYTVITINGDDWADPLQTINECGHLTLEQSVKLAVQWIAYYV